MFISNRMLVIMVIYYIHILIPQYKYSWIVQRHDVDTNISVYLLLIYFKNINVIFAILINIIKYV